MTSFPFPPLKKTGCDACCRASHCTTSPNAPATQGDGNLGAMAVFRIVFHKFCPRFIPWFSYIFSHRCFIVVPYFPIVFPYSSHIFPCLGQFSWFSNVIPFRRRPGTTISPGEKNIAIAETPGRKRPPPPWRRSARPSRGVQLR